MVTWYMTESEWKSVSSAYVLPSHTKWPVEGVRLTGQETIRISDSSSED